MANWVLPDLPQAFWGEVWIGGQPASIGTVIEGQAQNVRLPAHNNPFTMTEVGKLGGKGGFVPKLVVQGSYQTGGAGNIPSGSPVVFVVDGLPMWVWYDGLWRMSVPFRSGEVTQVVLAR